MSTQGTAILDFGAFPGSPTASVAVTGQSGIGSGSLVEAWIFPATTTDHSIDEHIIDPPEVIAGNIVVSTGFTIYGGSFVPFSMNWVLGQSMPQSAPIMYYGQYKVAWVWS